MRVIPNPGVGLRRTFRVVEDPNSTLGDLHRVFEYNPAVSARIISLANCAYYSRGTEIHTLSGAMASMGLDEVKRVVAWILRLSDLAIESGDLFDFWWHSVFVACASRVVSVRMGVDNPEKVFTIGLVHDIGKIPFYGAVEGYGATVKRMMLSGRDARKVEETLFRAHHGEVGGYIAVKWGLPEEFGRVITRHHGEDVHDDGRDALSIIRAADRFFFFPECASGAAGRILLRERGEIEKEVGRVFRSLGARA